MTYQMTKYLMKFIQNSVQTQDAAFMKNWDVISPYLSLPSCSSSNWFLRAIKPYLIQDLDTLLYIYYITKSDSVYRQTIDSS